MVRLQVADLERSLEYYTQVLGFDVLLARRSSVPRSRRMARRVRSSRSWKSEA